MLEAGHSYKIGIAVEDGQGGSGLVGRITAPGGSVLIVDPNSPDQVGWWSYGRPNQVIVDAGAELEIRSLNGEVNVLVAGTLDVTGAASSAVNSLAISNGGFVTLSESSPFPAPAGSEAAGALAVPEPGSFSLVLLGALGFLGRRQRSPRN